MIKAAMAQADDQSGITVEKHRPVATYQESGLASQNCNNCHKHFTRDFRLARDLRSIYSHLTKINDYLAQDFYMALGMISS
jgi:hypothetical protein